MTAEKAKRWIRQLADDAATLCEASETQAGVLRRMTEEAIEALTAEADTERLRAALTVCGTALHREGVMTDNDLLPLLHAAQQASGAGWTEWTPERLADDGLALDEDGQLHGIDQAGRSMRMRDELLIRRAARTHEGRELIAATLREMGWSVCAPGPGRPGEYCAVDNGGGPCWCGPIGCAKGGTQPAV